MRYRLGSRGRVFLHSLRNIVTFIMNMLILITIKKDNKNFLFVLLSFLIENDARKAINNSESYVEDKKWL